MNGQPEPPSGPNHPIHTIVAPSKEELRQNPYGVVEFPGENGHPRSRDEIAAGATYIAKMFRDLLKGADVSFESKRVDVPGRSSWLVEKLRDGVKHLLERWGFKNPKETDALRNFEQFKEETVRNYQVTLKLFEEGRRVLHAAASHDAIGRVAAFKKTFPNGLVMHFDKHNDLQKPGSGDNPGDSSAVNGHAVWVTANIGEGGPVLDQLLPKGAPLMERRDIFQAGIMHTDRSEAVMVAGGVDETGNKKDPIPCVTVQQLEDKKDPKEFLQKELRAWIDERKQRYGVDVIEMGIEDDPDSVRKEDIGNGITMPTYGGISSQFKVDMLAWLATQPDVKVMYYGTSEVIPSKDKGGKAKRQIRRWAGAALGFGDPEYHHGGYDGSAESGEDDEEAPTKVRSVVSHFAAAAAAALLALFAADKLPSKKSSDERVASVQTRADLPPRSFDKSPQAQRAANEFHIEFLQSNFQNVAGELRKAVDRGDAQEQQRLLEELASIYLRAEQRAPNAFAADFVLPEAALSEFTSAFGSTSKEYQQFIALRKKAAKGESKAESQL